MVRADRGLGGLALIWYTALPEFHYTLGRVTLDIQRILAELKAERDHIDQAIAAIGNIGAPRARRGRPPGKSTTKKKRKHKLTPEGRRRLSEMMKKRWAERRKKAA